MICTINKDSNFSLIGIVAYATPMARGSKMNTENIGYLAEMEKRPNLLT
jgi:hypothetical protein